MRLNILYTMLFVAVACFGKGKEKEIVILHTNDTHSQIMPFSKNLTDTLKADKAGFVRRLNLIKEERAKAPKMLLLDSGDFSQGSSYYTMFKGDVEVELMNLMGYDAATIGNHEFDFGMENMARIFKKAKFPIVCANYDFSGTECEGLVKPYIILKREGVKIGIFGLSPKIKGLVAEKNSRGVKYSDPVEVAQRMSKILKEDNKCDIVICLSHVGWKSDEGFPSDDIIAPQCKGIDLFLGGHSHTYLKRPEEVKDATGKTVYVDQNGKSGIFLSKLKLTLSVNN